MMMINGEEMTVSVNDKPTQMTFFVSKNCSFDKSYPKLKLSNLPPNQTENNLYGMLYIKYNILSLYMTRNNRNGRIGIASIEFEKEEDCMKCYEEMNGKRMCNFIVVAEIVNNDSSSKSPTKNNSRNKKGRNKKADTPEKQNKPKIENQSVIADDNEEKLCVICLDKPKVMALIPCGHRCLCEKCSEMYRKDKNKTCPECRSKIKDIIKIFE